MSRTPASHLSSAMHLAGDTYRRNGQHEYPRRNAFEAEELLPAPNPPPHTSSGEEPKPIVTTDHRLEMGDMRIVVLVERPRTPNGLTAVEESADRAEYDMIHVFLGPCLRSLRAFGALVHCVWFDVFRYGAVVVEPVVC